MLAAESEAIDIGLVLLDLLIVLLAAKLAAEVAERINVPAVLGEIVAGIVIGPSVLGLVDPLAHADVASMLILLGEIGVILLLLQVGMEMDLAELGKVGRASMLVGVIGVAVPMIAGFGVASVFGEEWKIALFIGAALTATSVGITARVFGDLKALSSTESRIVLGAAVADDVLGLLILTVVVKVVTEGTVGAGTVISTIGIAALFLVATGLAAVWVVPPVFDWINKWSRSGTTLTVAAFCLTLTFAELANAAKLAFIIGAFMAGLALGRTRYTERIEHSLTPLGNIFIPVFFASIGINADLEAMAKPEVLGLAAVLTVVAVIGKLVAAAGAAGTKSDKFLIGVGMVPRGEVGLIFASIGLTRGVLDDDLYGAVLIVVLVTTLITPPVLRWRLVRTQLGEEGSEPREVTPEPPQGWLTIDDDQIVLHGNPPSHLLASIALRSADLAASARPSANLLDWLAEHRTDEVHWTPGITDELLPLLRNGNPRTWRFLEVTGVLERALPEVERAVQRRRSDPSMLDPAHPLHFPAVDHVADLLEHPERDAMFTDVYAQLKRPALLPIAALLKQVARDTGDDTTLESLGSTLRPLDVDMLRTAVVGSRTLERAARELERLEPEQVARIAHDLADAEAARLAYLLAIAGDGQPRWRRELLDEVFRGVQSALA